MLVNSIVWEFRFKDGKWAIKSGNVENQLQTISLSKELQKNSNS